MLVNTLKIFASYPWLAQLDKVCPSEDVWLVELVAEASVVVPAEKLGKPEVPPDCDGVSLAVSDEVSPAVSAVVSVVLEVSADELEQDKKVTGVLPIVGCVQSLLVKVTPAGGVACCPLTLQVQLVFAGVVAVEQVKNEIGVLPMAGCVQSPLTKVTPAGGVLC